MTIRGRLVAGFLASILVLVVGAFAYDALSSAEESGKWVRHTRSVLTAIEATRSSLLDAETGERGYLLTSNSTFLAPYEEATAKVERSLSLLRQLTSDSTAQKSRLDALEPVIRSLASEFQETIRLERSEAHAEALARVRRGEAQQYMNEARVGLDAMLAAEEALLESRRATYQQALHSATTVVLAGSGVAFLFGSFATFGIWRSVEAEKRNQRAAKEHAERDAAQRAVLEEYDRVRLEKQRALTENLRDANLKLDEHVRELAAAKSAQDRALVKHERAMAALEKTNVELDQFAYVASHDLKAPLRGIASLSEWVEEDLGAAMTDQSRTHMKLLRGRIYRMEALIDGILAYSRAGRMRSASERLDVAPFIAEIVELLAPPKGVVTIAMPDGLVHIDAEKVPLQQVFINLIGNALKHASGPDARVVVTGADIGNAWEFSIRDNGPGIDPRYHERIFRIFHTLVARDKVEGTGIGLATVKKLVESRGGRIWLDSKPGEGASFSFVWPKPGEGGD